MKRAILIGSAKFDPDSGIEPLRFPEKDVTDLEAVLRTEDFAFDSIVKLIDEPNYAVTQRLDEVMSESGFDDFIVIYFSGHGKINAKGELFLSCRNTKEARLNGTGLRYKHIMELVEDHGKDRVVVILDCCYAGRAVSGLKGSVQEQVKAALDGRGIFLFGASGATQTAEERELDGNGIFTKQIIEGLSTGAADIDNDGLISLNDLAKYVRDEFRRKKISQDPISAGVIKYDDMFLGTNRRVVHAKAIAAIKAKVEGARTQFSKLTYRAIEDYVEEIEKRADIGSVEQEPRFQKLCAFASGASMEEVFETFRTEPRSSSTVAAVTANSITINSFMAPERAETDISNRVESSKSRQLSDTPTSTAKDWYRLTNRVVDRLRRLLILLVALLIAVVLAVAMVRNVLPLFSASSTSNVAPSPATPKTMSPPAATTGDVKTVPPPATTKGVTGFGDPPPATAKGDTKPVQSPSPPTKPINEPLNRSNAPKMREPGGGFMDPPKNAPVKSQSGGDFMDSVQK